MNCLACTFASYRCGSPRIEGGRVTVISPNDIGKSTLLRTLVGELAPDAGAVK